eukprot:s38_g34.t1
MDDNIAEERPPVRFKRHLEIDDDHKGSDVAEDVDRNELLETPPDFVQPDSNALVFDLDNLFGTQLESNFPDNWTPVSPATGDDASIAFQSEPCSCEPEVGTSLGHSAESSALGVSTGPVLTQSMHEALFSRNLLSNCNVAGIELPWDTDFYRDLFDEDDANRLVPKMPINDVCAVDPEAGPQSVAEAVAEVASFADSNPVHSMYVSCSDDFDFHQKRQQLRDAAIGKLLIVLRHCLLASVTGRHIIALGSEDQQSSGAYDVVDAVVGIRSAATLIKRANSLLSFLRWCAKAGISVVNPFDESFVWQYFQSLRESGAPPTRADSALSAFRFARHILGFECLDETVKSRRLVGICELMLSGKRLLRQALPLTVRQILRLHATLVCEDAHITDRAVIAYILFALYGRCRNSDLLHIRSMHLDFNDEGGFAIIETCNHKSGRLAALKTRLMPIIVPARGIDGSIWISAALSVFHEAGVLLENPIDGPLMHAPAGGIGLFMKRGFRTAEISSMLRRFLELEEPIAGSDMEIVSSHSLKATMLSWCARYGLSPATRSMLGRHTSCLNETFAIYSRDLVCAPVSELQTVIDAVASGNFLPDSQRSEFFKPGMHDTPAVGRDEGQGIYSPVPSVPYDPSIADDWEEVGSVVNPTCTPVHSPVFSESNNAVSCTKGLESVVENDEESDSSSSEGDGLSSDDSELAEPPPKVKRFRAKIPQEERWYVHSKSHLIHRFSGNEHNSVRFLDWENPH